MGRRAPATHPAPGLPRVNLLSPAAFEQAAVAALRRRFAVLVVALVVLVGAATAVQHLRARDARADVEAERAGLAALRSKVADLQPVQVYVDGVHGQAAVIQRTMITEMYFSRALRALAEVLPDGARVETLSIVPVLPAGPDAEEAPEAVGACPGPDPFATVVSVGCVTLTGRADDRADVGRLVDDLDQHKLFVEPFITTTTTKDGRGVLFGGSVALSPDLFSLRYADLAAELGEAVPSDDQLVARHLAALLEPEDGATAAGPATSPEESR